MVTTCSKIAPPKLLFTSPLKGQPFTEAEISFDVYSYYAGFWHVHGALFSLYDSYLGRMYFSKSEKLQFTSSGYAMYTDNVPAFNQSRTNVTISRSRTDYSNVISFFENTATFVTGTGLWWSDSHRCNGTYYDLQYIYLKNIKFTLNFSNSKSEKQLAAPNRDVVKDEYFNINGAKTSANFSTLWLGSYIENLTYSNGVV